MTAAPWLLLLWMHECVTAAAWLLLLWTHGCVSYGCMAAAAMNAWMRECMNAWMRELWMRGYVSYVSYGCVSYGYVRVDVVAINAWKHGSMEAWKHGSMEAWMREL